MPSVSSFLNELNSQYTLLHKKYEDLFWESYMGDHSKNTEKDEALKQLDDFRSDADRLKTVEQWLERDLSDIDRDRLLQWKRFFNLYQIPSHLASVKEKISKLDTAMHKRMAVRKEFYIDLYSGKKVKKSHREMRMMIVTHSDEAVRKACWNAIEEQSLDNLDDYVQFVGLLNKYARELGYDNYMEYNLQLVEGMSVKDVMDIFDNVYEKTKYAFQDVRDKEKEKGMKGLRKPWNTSYLLAGDFTKEEDQYFPFDKALERWGRSFSELGIDFAGGKLKLDLLSREGKYDNGFCHYPDVVHQKKNGELFAGRAQFTCNVVYGQQGAAYEGYNTLFHEGGHAADRLNSKESEACNNTEYPPGSTSWAETHSQFLDTMLSSYEWKSRYAYNNAGEPYPLNLYKRKVERLSFVSPLGLNSIIMVTAFERDVYTCKKLTREKVISFAKKAWKKYRDTSVDSIRILTIPHIYSFNSSCYYQGYGLADLALEQWRAYFYKKYGYIVDNPAVGKELKEAWSTGSRYTFAEEVKRATGKPLSADAWIKSATRTPNQAISIAKKRSKKVATLSRSHKPIQLNASIVMSHGKEVISTNKKSFEDMTATYAKWLEKRSL